MRQLFEVKHAHHIINRRDAVDQPGVLVTLNDLLFIVRRDQVAHHRAHHVVERHHAHDQAVFVEDDGKVFMGLLELVQHLSQRQLVGHDQHLADQAVVQQRDGLVVEHALEQILGVHIADDVVDIAFADGVGGEGFFGNACANHMVRVITQKVGHAVARSHGRGHGASVQLKDVGNGLLFTLGQHTGAGAVFGHGQDVVRGDLLVALVGQACHADDGIGDAAVEPHHGAKDGHAQQHGAQHHQQQALRLDHAQAAGQQVSKQDEQRGDEKERGHRAQVLRHAGADPVVQQIGERGAERAFTDDTAQNRNRVLTDLHHGEVITGLLLQLDGFFRARVTFVGHLTQTQTTGCGQRNLGHGNKGAGSNQQRNDEQALGESHKSGEWLVTAECHWVACLLRMPALNIASYRCPAVENEKTAHRGGFR